MFDNTTLTVGNREYKVAFTKLGRVTLCAIVWEGERKAQGVYGASARNPKDEDDEYIGKRLAFRRACLGHEDWRVSQHNRWAGYNAIPDGDARLLWRQYRVLARSEREESVML